jgi:hypothetical protein
MAAITVTIPPAAAKTQPRRCLAEHPLELRFHAGTGNPFHERELDGLEQLAPLPREIRNRLAELHAGIAFELALHRVLQLRPKAAQIGLEQLERVFDLRLNQISHLGFEVGLEFLLPLRLAENQSPGAPEGEIVLEQRPPFRFAAPTGLLDSAQKTANLSQSLLFPRLENPFEAGELFFVAHNGIEDAARSRGTVGEHYRRCLAGGH